MSAEQASINLNRPLKSVRIINNIQTQESDCSSLNADYYKRAAIEQSCEALNAAAAKLNQMYESTVVRYKEDIARLSVEIARRILAQKIQNGDYKIEEIVKEAIQSTPANQALEIHLNPADLEQCKDTIKERLNCTTKGMEFVSDPNVGRAECVIKTPKGTTESLIDIHLEKISEALAKAV
jgi:flagellar biosynthesis/type III secretory pathway protein FliH